MRATSVTATVLALSAGALVVDLVQLARHARRSSVHDHDLDLDLRRVGDGDGPVLRLTVLGDSAPAGFGLDDPDAAFPRLLARRVATATGRPVDVRSFAHRGVRVRGVLLQQVPYLPVHDPHVVVVAAGANDVLGRVPPWRVARHARALFRGVRAYAPHAIVAVGLPARLGDAPAILPPLQWLLNAGITLAGHVIGREARRAGIPAARLPRLRPHHFGPDRLHGNEWCHRAATDATFAVLEPLLTRSSTGAVRGGAVRPR